MYLAELTAYHVRIPLKTTIRHASHTRDSTDSLIIRARLSDGTEGWGEGLPRQYVTGETIDDAKQLLQTANLKKQLGGQFDSVPNLIEIFDQFRFDDLPPGARDCFGNSVRCAVEISLLDAFTRSQGRPFSEIVKDIPDSDSIRKPVDRVRYSGAITATSPWKERIRALKIRAYGFKQCKVKVGMPNGNDVASLRRLRGALGKQVDLRIDANEAWTCENLESRLKPLLSFNITSLEQPVPHADVAGLSKVRSRVPIPIMLDESLCCEFDARRAIDEGLCDLFNIRLSKCGGFVPSVRLAARAHQAGLGYQLGCQVGETGILSAAGRQFACSIGGIRYLEGSYDRHLVREPLTVEDLTFGYGGLAPSLTEPGLGITIDEQALHRVTISKDRWTIHK